MINTLLSRISNLTARGGLRASDVLLVAESLRDESSQKLRDRTAALQRSATAIVGARSAAAGFNILKRREWLAEAMALACEASRRVALAPYDVQIEAAIALTRPTVAEMQTGEGKTLATVLASVPLALLGRGVHVMTTNAYLAGRDADFARPILKEIGLSVGLLRDVDSPAVKRAAYARHVTYGPGYEFGFDYLRDQLALLSVRNRPLGTKFQELSGERPPAAPFTMQRGLWIALVDEVDSVLLDEACQPLILSQEQDQEQPREIFVRAAEVAARLQPGEDFSCDIARSHLQWKQQGLDRLATATFGPPPGIELEHPWWEYVQNALRASLFFKRDVHYVVRDGQLLLVDLTTGRLFSERRWQEGLHQAVEYKEGLEPSPPSTTTARSTRQRLFARYHQLSGTTGTAAEAAFEFRDAYRLSMSVISLRVPSQREVGRTRFFDSALHQHVAAASDAVRFSMQGRPVLIGCRTIHASRAIAEILREAGTECMVLNGCQDAEEAAIVAQAGRAGAVTVATNLAGRGTDIRLDAAAAEAGGLHVIGVECNDSPRIDRQLLGRAARQGDSGSGQFFVSAEDDLLRGDVALQRALREAADELGECRKDFSIDVARLQEQRERQRRLERRQIQARDRDFERFLQNVE